MVSTNLNTHIQSTQQLQSWVYTYQKCACQEHLGGSVKHLPSAQVMIPGSWDQAPRQAPCLVGSLLLPPPPLVRSLSLTLSLSNE